MGRRQIKRAGKSPALFVSGAGSSNQPILAGVMHIIIMPPQFIIIGMPAPIMLIMFWQHCLNMSFMESSIGPISQVIIPFGAIVQVILHIIIGMVMPGIPPIKPIIGIMPLIIGFIIMGVMPPIMLFIIGIIVCIAAFIGGSTSLRRILSSSGWKE
jgi:hypothetical protein